MAFEGVTRVFSLWEERRWNCGQSRLLAESQHQYLLYKIPRTGRDVPECPACLQAPQVMVFAVAVEPTPEVGADPETAVEGIAD